MFTFVILAWLLSKKFGESNENKIIITTNWDFLIGNTNSFQYKIFFPTKKKSRYPILRHENEAYFETILVKPILTSKFDSKLECVVCWWQHWCRWYSGVGVGYLLIIWISKHRLLGLWWFFASYE